MSTKLPFDVNDNPIPALRLKDGGAHVFSISASSSRNTSAFGEDTRVINVYTTEDVYLAFGDSGVTTGGADHFFPAGTYYDFAIGGDSIGHYTHVAALRVIFGAQVKLGCQPLI